MVELLDLPVELFQMITHAMVDEIGVHKVWKLRSVCRIFASEIEHDVFALQSKYAFYGYYSGRLLQNGIATLIMKRWQVPRDANKAILDKIKSIVETVDNSGEHPSTKEIIDRVSQMWSGGPKQLTWDIFSAKWEVAEANPFDDLSTAIAHKAYDAIETLLRKLPTIYDREDADTFLVCKPLQMAIQTNDSELLRIVLAFLKSFKFKKLTDLNRDTYLYFIAGQRHPVYDWVRPIFPVDAAVKDMIKDNNAAIAQVLMDFYLKNLPSPGRDVFDGWVETVMIRCNEEILALLLDSNFKRQGKSMVTPRRTLTAACEHVLEFPYAIEAVIQRLPGGINDGTILSLPIFIALRLNNRPAMEKMIELGADIHIKVKSNLPLIEKDMVSPIDVAIHRNYYDIIDCLVMGGAVLPHCSEWPFQKKTWRFLRALKPGYPDPIPTFEQRRRMTQEQLKAIEYD
ncbi:hypothetical protein N0V83_010934 [Neocucurbitaria cava]|uniref:Uncharacterized protein n=1 Tax=Neocucurbitaria cava TaxID=798079 RepID=A0A9W9CGD4_9PLEO|nr:hypothetical protein N0V83_010934 [Neocucurbitaria cava]